MTNSDPKTAERMREALELIADRADDQVGRARARICALVKSIAADAKGLEERVQIDGSDAVDAAFVAMHVRELVEAQAELSDRRELVREIHGIMEFVQRAASGKKTRP